jgi:hypothetical protein
MADHPEHDQELVEGRECGECTVCCKDLTVDTPTFKKLPGIACDHCIPSSGCGIYSARPDVCRTWFCGWRRIKWMDDTLRPDRSGILVRFTVDDIPNGYVGDTGIIFDVIGPCDGLLRPGVAEAIGGSVAGGIATFLAVPGLPGFVSTKVLLNPNLVGPVERQDGDAARAELVRAFIHAALRPKGRVVLS